MAEQKTDLSHAGLLQTDDVPEDSLLGYLVGVVHHKFNLKEEEMEPILEASGLPDDYWPNKAKPMNAFYKACRSLEQPRRQKVTFQDPGSDAEIWFEVEFMVDQLKGGARQLTRKIHFIGNENASKALQDQLRIYAATTQKEPEKMAVFDYDAEEDYIEMTPLYGDESLNIKDMTEKQYEKLKKNFDAIKGAYSERSLKTAWYRMLHQEGGIPWLKNCGSLWFIPKQAKQSVKAFGYIYKSIHNGTGTWRDVPIIDTEQHRNYLKEDVMVEYQDRYKQFLKSIADKMERDMSEEKRKELLRKSKDDFEEKMNRELLKQYNDLLNMSISAKVNDFEVSIESSRLEKARKMLANL